MSRIALGSPPRVDARRSASPAHARGAASKSSAARLRLDSRSGFRRFFRHLPLSRGPRRMHLASCYLIRHGDRYLLWDTGVDGALAGKPAASQAGLAISWKHDLAEQLARIALKPGRSRLCRDQPLSRRPYRPGAGFPALDLADRLGRLGGDQARPAGDARFAPWLGGVPRSSRSRGDKDVFGDGKRDDARPARPHAGASCRCWCGWPAGQCCSPATSIIPPTNRRSRRRAAVQHQPRRYTGLDRPLRGAREEPQGKGDHPA